MSTPTTPSGKALLAARNFLTDAGDDYLAERIVAIERESFLAGLDSPEMLELLAGALKKQHGGPRPWTRAQTSAEFAESILASMRSSLRAETPE